VFYMLGVVAVMAYGWRKLFVGNREKLELAREKMWSRIHIMPLLQAEEDRDQVRRMYADKAREKQLLGSETGVMNSDRYVCYPVTGQKREGKAPQPEEAMEGIYANGETLQVCETDIHVLAWLDEGVSANVCHCLENDMVQLDHAV